MSQKVTSRKDDWLTMRRGLNAKSKMSEEGATATQFHTIQSVKEQREETGKVYSRGRKIINFSKMFYVS
jgi:hypothetical protein